MPVPDFQSIMLPFVEMLSDGQTVAVRTLTAQLSDHFKLSESERQEKLPSGEQSLISNRVAWAKTHLKNAGLIENPSRGQVRISDLGRTVLLGKPALINCRFLKQYPSYLRFIGQPTEDDILEELVNENSEASLTPKESIDASFLSLKNATSEEMLERLKKCSPGFFEIVVIRLLKAMGYGVLGEATVTGKPGDGGIDGIIKEDKLGLDTVCVQAKRWEGTVGRPVVQGFVGSMDYSRSKKGVIITTSSYTKEALDYVERIEGKKVVLIDGSMMTDLMIEHNVGVHTTMRYELREVSNDFFEEDEG